RRAREKNAFDQLGGDARVERRAHLDIVVEADLPLQYDERSNPLARHRDRRLGDLLQRLAALEAIRAAEERRRADLGQGAPDIALKDDDDDDNDRAEKIIEYPIERKKTQPLRSHVDQQHDHEPHDHLHRTGTAHHRDQPVDDKGDNEDVEEILPAELSKYLKHGALPLSPPARSAARPR